MKGDEKMKYPILKNQKEHILDDSNIIEVLNKVKNLIGKNFEVELETDDDLVLFLNKPEVFIEDEETIDLIKELRELIEIMGEVYHV